MSLYYYQGGLNTGEHIQLSDSEARHATGVLRSKVGDKITLTDGRGTTANATVISPSPKSFTLSVDSVNDCCPAFSYNLHIAVAPTKNIDRYEWFLEKATEIGVSRITPLLASHSERKIVKFERGEKILVSAMKQSQKAYLPELDEMTPIKEFLESTQGMDKQKFIAHCDDAENKIELYHSRSEERRVGKECRL